MKNYGPELVLVQSDFIERILPSKGGVLSSCFC